MAALSEVDEDVAYLLDGTTTSVVGGTGKWIRAWRRCFGLRIWRCGWSTIAAYGMWQSSPFFFINLVVVIERGFVCMAGDLNYFVPWLSGFLQFGDNCFSGGMVWNLLSINDDRLCQGRHNAAKFVFAHPGLGVPNFGFSDAILLPSTRPRGSHF